MRRAPGAEPRVRLSRARMELAWRRNGIVLWNTGTLWIVDNCGMEVSGGRNIEHVACIGTEALYHLD